ncbi:MAG: trypsin-like peptidase domain-containing protein [Candidatus Kapaibacteriota bacterium]
MPSVLLINELFIKNLIVLDNSTKRAQVMILDSKNNTLEIDTNFIRILENNIPAKILKINCPKEETAVPSVLTIDESGSMQGNGITIARSAATTWINKFLVYNQSSECAINAFSTFNRLLINFTNSYYSLLSAINSLYPNGGTDYNVALLNYNESGLYLAAKGGQNYGVSLVDDTYDFPGLDITIIKVDDRFFNFLPLFADEIKVGEDVVAIGHPNGDYWNQSKGTISRVNLPDVYMLQHDVPTDEGNSGGPLINSKGQVEGVVTAYKKMNDNNGNIKIQETGKLATKISWVIEVLKKRGIKYYTQPKLYGNSEYENLVNMLEDEISSLKKEREQLRKDKEKFQAEQTEFYKMRADYEKQKYEAQVSIENAKRVNSEIDKRNKELDKREKDLDKRENNLKSYEQRLDTRERTLADDEKKLQEKIEPRMAIDLNWDVNYLAEDANRIENSKLISTGLAGGIFWKFGFDRDRDGYPTSHNRIGFIYQFSKVFTTEKNYFYQGYKTKIYFALEFDNTVRTGFGVANSHSMPNNLSNINYSTFISLHLNKYPWPVMLQVGTDVDNELRKFQIWAGISIGYSLNFFKF